MQPACAPRGLPGEHQVHQHHPQLVAAEPVAVRLGLHQAGDEVVARMGAAAGDDLVHQRVELNDGAGDALLFFGDADGEEQAEVVGQRREAGGVLVRQAHELAEDPGRVRVGERRDEFHRAVLGPLSEAVAELLGDRAHARPEQLDGTRRERLGYQLPEPTVPGAFGREQHIGAELEDRPGGDAKPLEEHHPGSF